MNTCLDKNTQEKLIALGNKRYHRTLVLTVVWIVLVLTVFVVSMIVSDRSFSDPRNYIILILCILPFFPFGAHKVLFSKSFYATVSYNVHATQFESLKWAGTRNRPERVAVLEITFKKDNGKEIMIAYKKSTYPLQGFHYDEGDRVFFVRGLKYPYKFPTNEGMKCTCPMCGTTVETDNPICRRCGLDVFKPINNNYHNTESETP